MTPEIFRLPAVVAACGISRSTIYEMIRRGEFPRPIKLGARAVGWRRSDIEAWLASRPAARISEPSPVLPEAPWIPRSHPGRGRR